MPHSLPPARPARSIPQESRQDSPHRKGPPLRRRPASHRLSENQRSGLPGISALLSWRCVPPRPSSPAFVRPPPAVANLAGKANLPTRLQLQSRSSHLRAASPAPKAQPAIVKTGPIHFASVFAARCHKTPRTVWRALQIEAQDPINRADDRAIARRVHRRGGSPADAWHQFHHLRGRATAQKSVDLDSLEPLSSSTASLPPSRRATEVEPARNEMRAHYDGVRSRKWRTSRGSRPSGHPREISRSIEPSRSACISEAHGAVQLNSLGLD